MTRKYRDEPNNDVRIIDGLWYVTRDGGADHTGSRDATSRLQGLLDRGDIITLASGGVYRITEPLIATIDGSGIVAPNGATIVMDMASGAFDNDVYADRANPTAAKHAVGIYASGVADFIVQGVKIIPSVYTDVRYTTQIMLDDCDDARIVGVEITNFSRGAGCIKLVDCARPVIEGCYVHHCYTASTTGATGTTIQITGIEVDDNSSTGSYSGIIRNNRITDLTNSAAILTAVGNVQSDAINLKGTDNKTRDFLIEGNIIDNVAEGVDLFGYTTKVVNNHISRCFGVGIKVFHGASYNLIAGNLIHECGLAGIYTGGSNSSSINARGNTFRDNKVVNVNRLIDWTDAAGNVFFDSSGGTQTFWTDVYASGVGTITAGIRIDVLSGGSSQVEGALFDGNHLDLGGNADRGVFHEGSSGGFTSTIRPHVITGVVSGGRDYQDSTGYLVFENFPWQTIQQKTVKTLANNTSAQTIFDGDGAGTYSGTLTVTAGEFIDFELFVIVTGLSGSSKDLSFSLGGTASYTTIALKAHGGLSATSHNLTPITVATATVVTNTATDTTMTLAITGKIHVNAGGTIIPQLTQNTASAAASLLRGSHCRIRRSQSQHISGGWA